MQTTAYELPRPPRRLGPSVPIAHCMPLGLGLKQRVITSGAWSPLSLGSNLAFWYEAFLGGSASSATDLSGNGNTLSGGGANPTYTNGGSGASWWDFSGNANAQLIGGSLTLPQPFEIFAVEKITVSATTNQRLFDFGGGNVCNLFVDTSGNWNQFNSGIGAVQAAITGSFVVIDAPFNGVSSGFSQNNGTQATGTLGGAGPSAAQFSMGNLFGGGFNFNGQVGEIFAVKTPLSGADLTNAHAYFLSKWGHA